MRTVLTFVIAIICVLQDFAQTSEPLDTAQFSSQEETLIGTLLSLMEDKNENTLCRNITGKVVDENNSPLDFVNVVLLNADSTYIAATGGIEPPAAAPQTPPGTSGSYLHAPNLLGL